MAGTQCCENPPALSSSSGHGSGFELRGLKTYVSGSSDSQKAILLISDIFGYEAPNLRKLADKVAAEGYYVVVPDFFYGEPYNPENKERTVQVWLQSHGTDIGFEDAKQVIAALKDKGISAIGAAGFCWGGKVVVQLAMSENIQAAVLLHPSFVSVDDFKEVKAPIAILGAEIDHLTPPELFMQFKEILSSKPEVDSFVKIYPGVAHGWTVRYNEEDKKAVQSAEEAHQDMLNWFAKHVK
ncbi:endo-1,3;1,4-beta-D-glucanase-like [Solanum verrucosum]|uniref:endo-1,3;1,4-beta-D-glucanase-like n=1 Tax=Solanum verrucosum TaxID=315347 RepID=UPI0020D19F7E|nr:endo-1,3;1,4-beta-D-glucanase-like [Solanum verrucosum]